MEEKRSNLKRHFNACSVTSSPVKDERRRSMNKQGSCIAAYRAGRWDLTAWSPSDSGPIVWSCIFIPKPWRGFFDFWVVSGNDVSMANWHLPSVSNGASFISAATHSNDDFIWWLGTAVFRANSKAFSLGQTGIFLYFLAVTESFQRVRLGTAHTNT